MNAVTSDLGGAGAAEAKAEQTFEERTTKARSSLFLWGAGLSILGSLFLESLSFGRPVRRVGRYFLAKPRFANLGLFVGQWVPTLLLLAVYNKMVQIAAASERRD